MPSQIETKPKKLTECQLDMIRKINDNEKIEDLIIRKAADSTELSV
jgi:hypothetical protein